MNILAIVPSTYDTSPGQRFRIEVNIPAPASGDVWTKRFVLGHKDKGYDYLALVGVSVQPKLAAWWAPSVVAKRNRSGVRPRHGRDVCMPETFFRSLRGRARQARPYAQELHLRRHHPGFLELVRRYRK